MKHYVPVYDDMCCLEDAGMAIVSNEECYYRASEADPIFERLELEIDALKDMGQRIDSELVAAEKRIAELENALHLIHTHKPGEFWSLQTEILIHETAAKALGL